MKQKHTHTPISENPSVKEIKTLLPTMKMIGGIAGLLGKLGFKREALLSFKSQVDDLAEQASILDLPDRFNAAFVSKGWIAVGSALSVETMNAALQHRDLRLNLWALFLGIPSFVVL